MEPIKEQALFIYHDEDRTNIKLVEFTPPVRYKGELWKKMQAFIGTDDLEHVSVYWMGGRGSMFVDETGLLKKLPINTFATSLYAMATIKRTGKFPNELSSIAGRAVLLPPSSME